MKLSSYMTEKGIQPRELAEMLGDASESGVRKWMYGERVPRPEQMRRIAEITSGKVQPNDFILENGAAA